MSSPAMAAVAPDALTSVVAAQIAATAAVHVDWAPGFDGGSPITSYTATTTPGGLTCMSSAAPPDAFCDITGLTVGVSYTVAVIATNGSGDSVPSADSAAVLIATVPDPPTAVSAAAVGSTQNVDVSWAAPANDGGSAITGYTATSTPQNRTCTAGPTGTGCTFSGLTRGVTYTFTVVATNGLGDSAQSGASAGVLVPTVPGVPTNVSAVIVGVTNSADVAWVAPASDGGSPITGYTAVASPGTANCTTTGTACTVSGLTHGATFTFTVIATNAVGNSPRSSPSGSVSVADFPSQPTGVAGSGAGTTVTVTWSAPASDGGSAITAYTATASPGGATCSTAGAPPALTCDVVGLTPGTTYTFRVVATNGVGNSAASGASAGVTVPATLPGAPTGVTASATGTSVHVSWAAAPNGGSPITVYTATASPGGLFCTSAGLTCTIGGLSLGGTYTVTVVATNAVGDGPPSSASAAVTIAATAPGSPTGVAGVASGTSVDVSWVAPASDGGSAITTYTATASPGGATCSSTAPPAPSCTIGGLTPGTTYTFRVVATNGVGSSAASSSSQGVLVPPNVPAPPSGVVGVVSGTSVSLTWSAPASNGGAAITSYTATAAPGGLTCSSLAPTRQCTVGGLTPGVLYTFTVVATNVAGDSQPSSSSAGSFIATVPVAPTVVSAAAVGTTQSVDVSWVASASNGGSAITLYTATSSPQNRTCTTTGSGTGCTISALTRGITYTFTVVATNSVGDSPASGPSAGVLVPTVPGLPTGVSAVVVGVTTSADVAWVAPASDGGAPITSYTVVASPGTANCTTTTGTACTVTGLTRGAPFTFTVFATNVLGNGSRSLPSAAVSVLNFPGPPTGVVGAAAGTSVDVSWTAPASDGGSAITSFTATSSPGGYTCTAPATSTTCTVVGPSGGLTRGQTYTFRVVATNAVGDGPLSAGSAGVTIPATSPDAPTAATGTPISPTVAHVSWLAPAINGGSAIASYTATSSPVGLTCTSTTTTSCNVSGLSPGSTYTFTVVATNAVTSSASSTASPPVAMPPTVPDAPTGVTATAASTDASVAWTAPAYDGGGAVTSYTVTSAPSGRTCTSAGTACTVTGLAPGVTYSFTVIATNPAGRSAASVSSNAVTIPLPTPAPAPAPAPRPVPVPVPPVVPPSSTDKTPPLAAKGLTAVGQLAKDGTVGARLAWLLPGNQDVKSVRVGISQGTATPTSTQKVSGAVVVVTRFGATLSRLQPGITYTVAVYTVDAAANVSPAVKATLVGSTSRVTVTGTTHAGLPVTVRGSLSDARGKPLAKLPVDLLVRTVGSRTWRVYKHGTTSSSGSVSLTAKPLQNSEFTLRFAGGRGRLGVSSGRTATVFVHVVVVASVRAASGGIVAPKGSSARVTGQVLPGKRGKSVLLQKLVNRQWVTVSTAHLDGKGNFSFTLSTAATGVFAYLVRAPLDSTNLAGGSPELYLRVT